MMHDPDQHASLGAMYSDYFLDYASYVILERAVPTSTTVSSPSSGAFSTR